LRAVNERLLEIAIFSLELIPDRRLSKDRAATLLTENLMDSLQPDARNHYIAHHEVLLQSARDHHLRHEISAARQRFVDVVARILSAVGCGDPDSHAPGVVAMLDGLLIDQLLYSDTPIDAQRLTSQIRRLLAQC
jgi:hypothetical protein